MTLILSIRSLKSCGVQLLVVDGGTGQWLVDRVAALAVRGMRLLGAQISLAGVDEATAELESLARYKGRRLLFVHPIEDVVPRLVMDCALRERRGATYLGDALFVCSDSLVGQFAASVLSRIGRGAITLSSKRPSRRISDLRRLAREARPVCIVANGFGGEYVASREGVHPGLWPFAKSRRAVVVPVAVACSRAISIAWPWRLTVPAPFSRVAVVVGEPVDTLVADGGDDDDRDVRRSQRLALGQAVALARAASAA